MTSSSSTWDEIPDGLTPPEREKILRGTVNFSPVESKSNSRSKSTVVDLRTEAVKFDQGKEAWHLLPIIPIRELIKLLMFGASKYASHNWRHGFDYSRCYDALMRHLQQWWLDGEDIDQESNCHHLACVMFYCCVLIEFSITGAGRDDRKAHTSGATFQKE